MPPSLAPTSRPEPTVGAARTEKEEEVTRIEVGVVEVGRRRRSSPHRSGRSPCSSSAPLDGRRRRRTEVAVGAVARERDLDPGRRGRVARSHDRARGLSATGRDGRLLATGVGPGVGVGAPSCGRRRLRGSPRRLRGGRPARTATARPASTVAQDEHATRAERRRRASAPPSRASGDGGGTRRGRVVESSTAPHSARCVSTCQSVARTSSRRAARRAADARQVMSRVPPEDAPSTGSPHPAHL